MKTTKEILKDIMVLNPKERAFIVEKLLESLDGVMRDDGVIGGDGVNGLMG